jgi:NAD(P)-dependent dehydrogenase (short-subunit alcohol dehydrogenase family)
MKYRAVRSPATPEEVLKQLQGIMKKIPPAILVTASSRRLGFAFAKESLAMGYSVIGHYRSGTGAFGSWLRRHPEHLARVFFVRADLDHDPGRAVSEACRLPVRLTGLVNNASVFRTGNVTDPGSLRNMLATNACAPMELSARFFQEVGKGWIINITDAHAAPVNRAYQNYRISKLLLTEITRQCAFTFAPSVRVNAIAPGAVLPARGRDPSYFSTLAQRMPLRRTPRIADLMLAYRYLVENRSVTGQVLCVDSGWHLAD